jgi:hypothetical protein
MRIFAVAWTILGAYFIYSFVKSWLFFASSPIGEQMLRVVAEMLIFAASMFITGIGMLARRQWAWRGALLVLTYLVTRWMAVGVLWLLQAPVSEAWRPLAIGLLPPVLLSVFGHRFLCAPSSRAIFDAESVRVLRGTLLVAGLAILVTVAWTIPAWHWTDS